MKHSLKTGLSFGLTSGIITTLGLIIGLNASTQSRAVVIGGILVIAIADAFSDAFGIHMSEESENHHTIKQVWASTISTFLAKFFFASIFIVPILLFPLGSAIVFNVILGLLLLAIFSFSIAKTNKVSPWKTIGEHLVIALVVIVLTHYIGTWIGNTFK